MNTITVIGAGTMGNGIAQVFASKGFSTYLMDVSKGALEKAMAKITKSLEKLESKGLLEGTAKEILENLTPTTDLKISASHSDLIVEAATENLDLKRKIFQQLDENASSHCLLASNTSSISITEIASATSRPDKVIGMHFMNPVPLMKLVEVINGYSTSEETSTKIVDLCKKLGKTPVESKDYPGFIANRILLPMINEAVCTLYEGVGTIEAIDEVMKLGMNHPMGPLQLADFIGLDVCLSILEVLYEGFKQPKYAPCPLLSNMVNAGKLGRKSGEGFYKYT